MKISTLPFVSNREDFLELYEVIDEESGTAISIQSMTASFAIRDPDNHVQLITGATSSGEVTRVDSNTKFQVAFSASVFNGLPPKTYEVGMTVTDTSGTVKQLIVGYLPVLDGIVS